jgi:hypothetical protein
METTTLEILPPAGQLQPLVLKLDEGLTPDTAQSLRSAFEEYFTAADEWRQKALSIQITRPDQFREMKLARETRLALREIRINAEKTRKALKEDSLKKGKAIDGIYNMLAYAVEPLEKHLLEQEQFIQRIEEERKAQLKALREEALRPFTDVSLYQLGEMDAATFADLLDTHKLAFAARQEVARKAEAERIERERLEAEERAKREAEAAAERERIRAENERLKAEREAAEIAAKAEREAAQAEARRIAEETRKEREAIEAKAKAEREAIEAKAKAEREAIEAKAKAEREAAAAQQRKVREAFEASQAALKAKEEAEARAKAEQEAAARAAAAAPDREKLDALAQAIRSLTLPEMSTNAGIEIQNLIREQMAKFATWIEGQKTKLN